MMPAACIPWLNRLLLLRVIAWDVSAARRAAASGDRGENSSSGFGYRNQMTSCASNQIRPPVTDSYQKPLTYFDSSATGVTRDGFIHQISRGLPPSRSIAQNDCPQVPIDISSMRARRGAVQNGFTNRNRFAAGEF